MEKDKDIITIIVDDAVNEVKAPKPTLKSYIDGIHKNLSPSLVNLSGMLCAGVVVIALAVGFLVPKSEQSVNNRILSMHTSDKAYLEAKEEYTAASDEVKVKEKELEEAKRSVEKADNAQSSIDKIISDNATLREERDLLKKELEEKENKLSEYDALINANKSKTVTLNSGEYTVGKNIAQGKYNVIGNGTIAVSRSGKSVANKPLKSDGESFTLQNDDKIVISGSAKFVPE